MQTDTAKHTQILMFLHKIMREAYMNNMAIERGSVIFPVSKPV